MQIFDNTTKIVKDDLEKTIKKGSRVDIAAACFSIYAYSELKKQLNKADELRFIFTQPAFLNDREEKQRREFYIPRRDRENSLYGSEFEIKLRNELTQKAIAKECADWIKEKARFKANVSGNKMGGFINVKNRDDNASYMPIDGFTTVDIGCGSGDFAYNIINKLENTEATAYLNLFDRLWEDKKMLKDVTDTITESISAAYTENPPELIYFLTLYNVFSEFLNDISQDELPNEATGFKQSKIWNMLYDFQKDAALAVINKLEKYNGCILADSVGLGKTFTALAVIKYYENRNKNVLVLCPKKLSENWNTFKANYLNNPIASDRMNYDVLFHTDLSRDRGTSNGIDLERINWGNYDLVVIDESHNFRNGIGTHSNTHENRYMSLMDRVMKAGVKTKALMLSATPVNNRFTDLKNQLALAYEGDESELDDKLDTSKTINEIFRQAQAAFNKWSKQEPDRRTTEALLKTLDFDFFELLDSVTIARSRKHIEKFYDTDKIGKFPERRKPVSIRPDLTDIEDAINYNQIYEQLMLLSLSVYTPSRYIFPSKLNKYMELTHNKGNRLTQAGRETGIMRLMSINLLKRLESSVNSFALTVSRILDTINYTIEKIEQFERSGIDGIEATEISSSEFDGEDENTEFFSVGRKVKINLADMDYVSWKDSLKADAEVLELLTLMVKDITPEHDTKLQTLLKLLSEKIENPINNGNKKALIFTAFSDTADYLYENVSKYIKEKYGLDCAVITGSIDGKSTVKGLNASFNNVLTYFSPKSKNAELMNCKNDEEIDILIATDCISEGQNLQDCDYLVNYDIHWNPVRIIQRFGRIDRIGSENASIQLVNFWPDIDLDEYIKLKDRVETRMRISVMTGTGDDDLINAGEKGDLEYRRQQLMRLQEEVVDIEDMTTGISILDLGLNEFRLDLLEYVKTHADLDKLPKGLHAVAAAKDSLPPGIIFVLRNVNEGINIDKKNRIHPFYMVYISDDGEVVTDYLNPKAILDNLRLLCRDENKPIPKLYKTFNEQTKDGKDMAKPSALLADAVSSIIAAKEKSDIDSFLSGEQLSFISDEIKGLNDFELISFLVVR